MKVHLVTGGNGFVGNALIHDLLKRGFHVRTLDIIKPAAEHSHIEFYCESVLNKKALHQALQGVNVVHHLAAAVPLIQSDRAFHDVNTKGTQFVYEAAQRAGVEHFNFMSSSAVYGMARKNDCPISEELHPQPFEAYGRSKMAAEQYLLSQKNSSMTRSIIRPRTVIGPGRMGIFDLLFSWIANSKPIYMIGDGSNLLQFIHVADLAEACVLATEKRVSGIYNIGAKKFRPLKDSILQLCAHAKSHSKLRPIPTSIAIPALYTLDKLKLSPFSAWHYKSFHKDYYFNTNKAETELGWIPHYSNDEMLTQAYDWFIQNHRLLTPNGSIHQRPLKSRILSLFN